VNEGVRECTIAAGVTGTTLLVWIVLIALIVFRASRPPKISVARMWVSPILLMALAGFAIFVVYRKYQALEHAPVAL